MSLLADYREEDSVHIPKLTKPFTPGFYRKDQELKD